MAEYQRLDETFIREYFYDLYTDDVWIYQKLSTKFLNDFINDIDWELVIKYQILTWDFIFYYSDRMVDYKDLVIKYQCNNLSEKDYERILSNSFWS